MLSIYFLAVAIAADPPKPKITVSKETTYITEPLRADGMVDYTKAFIDSQGTVKPEDNAVVLLIKALGPFSKGWKPEPEYFTRLGISEPLPGGAFLKDDVETDLEEGQPNDPSKPNAMTYQAYWRLMKEPWKPSKAPYVATMIARNNAPLDLVVEASKRPRYWEPYIPRKASPDEFFPRQTLTDYPTSLFTLLRVRAMLRMGSGEVERGLADLDAAHRLTELMSAGARTQNEVGTAAFSRPVICESERGVAFSGKLSSQKMRERCQQLMRLQELGRPSQAVMNCERMIVLNFAADELRKSSDSSTPLKDRPFMQVRDNLPEKWPIPTKQSYSSTAADACLRTINRVFDRWTDAYRHGTPREQRDAVVRLEAELKSSAQAARELYNGADAAKRTNVDDRQLGQMTGNLAVGLFVAYRWSDPLLYSEASRRHAVLAYAFAASMMEKGKHPDRLDAVQLGVPPTMTIDPFTDKPFVERTVNGKRQIVSVGMDGVLNPRWKMGDERNPDDRVLELP